MAEYVEIDGKRFEVGVLPYHPRGHGTIVRRHDAEVAEDVDGIRRAWFWGTYGCSPDCWYLR